MDESASRLDEVTDVEAIGGWIRLRLSGPFATATMITPSGYESYVRVLHPVRDHTGRTRTWSSVAEASGAVLHSEAQWWCVAGADADDRRSITSCVGHPSVGRLGRATTKALMSVLVDRTTTPQHCFFGVWEGAGWAMHDDLVRHPDHGDDMDRRIARMAQGPMMSDGHCRYVLLAGPADAMAEVGDHFGDGGHEMLGAHIAWPEDRAWFVATGIDYDSTIVACDQITADAVLAHPLLEAVAFPPTGRLDIDADTVNNPRR
ncbi:hypothetical protein [uncultured Williamsia sp.]|uniref:hypothetical protein n=1 Tax=uncultured Williamsia sp. TaxID=259311 RepID=UPI002604D845|nr:hypothetical protein [uncultured Williamsia sp.]